ncbi:MAG TPA: 1,4-beta-xylanase, partial [Verrucomicrobiae bacterium]|nr:1,4-beta-xylanase [Verrucomicrobiae bacterium]
MIFLFLAGLAAPAFCADGGQERWSEQKANDWANKTGWLVGCNFIPSTAVNELEMWQAETYD